MERKEVVINKRTYNVVDQYVYGTKAISILERNGQFFIDNYEGMGLFVGPFAEAVKTGDNGEVLVRDFKKDYYYVPAIKGEKPHGISFLKEYHPEYHFAKPYRYYNGSSAAIALMEDGSYRMKYSTGRISEQKYKTYKQFDCLIDFDYMRYLKPEIKDLEDIHYHIDYYQTEEGKHFIRALDLELPLYAQVSENFETYYDEDELALSAVSHYLNYSLGLTKLEDLPHQMFNNDTVLQAILSHEKAKIKEMIAKQSSGARTTVESAAKKEDLSAIDEVDIDMGDLQSKLDKIAAIVIEKRKVAIREQQKLAQIDKQEYKAENKANAALDFETIVKKAAAKPRKKNEPGSGGNQNNPTQKGEE